MQTNQALRIHSYGGPEVLQRDDIPMPVPGASQVLIRIKAAGVGPDATAVSNAAGRSSISSSLAVSAGVRMPPSEVW